MASSQDRRAKQEQAALDHIRQNNGFFSIFWAIESRLRACALARLEKSGRIVRNPVQPAFPFNRYFISE